MSKKSKKKSGKKKPKARKNPKRVAAAKKAYAKSRRAGKGLAGYNKKKNKKKSGGRKKGYASKKGKKSGKSKAKSYAAKKSSFSGGAVLARARFNKLVARLEEKGYDKKTATGLAKRAVRQSAAMGRGAAKHKAAEEAAAKEAYMPGNYARHVQYY